jgi:phosphoribosyl-ATP pyrophosphohydrolase
MHMNDVIATLDAIIAQRRRNADPTSSYVAKLSCAGVDQILKKVAEECGETLIAAKNTQHGGESDALVRETADLWFHCLVMLAEAGLSGSDVLRELERRFDVSGIAEKAARMPHNE